jgi:hypothetical protein
MNDLAGSSLEEDLASFEADASALAKRLTDLLGDVKKLRALAAKGLVRDLRKLVQALPERAEVIAGDVRRLRNESDIAVGAMMASGAFAQELVDRAREADVAIEEQDGRLLCYPSVILVSPSDESVLIDKKRERRLRPSVLVEHLKMRQDRPPTFKPEAFLETLEGAYDLQIAKEARSPGSVVKLVDLHRILTLLPTQKKEYPLPDFTRDLYLLDQSGIQTTKSQRRMELPASALTRGTGVLQTVTKSGQHKIYAGVSFT